jgi:hypothetical protein
MSELPIWVWWMHMENPARYTAVYLARRLGGLIAISGLPTRDLRLWGPGLATVTWCADTGEVTTSC